MKKKLLAGLATGLVVFGIASVASATLTTIGTATYGGTDYNLIWDNDNNGNSVVWLDYSNVSTDWAAQNTWAAGLDTSLTYNIDAAYNVTWDVNSWRLGSTVDGITTLPVVHGNDGTTPAGYNITSSEMGHLYYTELNNLGYYDTSGVIQPGSGLVNTGDFNNLTTGWYWSSTANKLAATLPNSFAWIFNMGGGLQSIGDIHNPYSALALRNAQVSVNSVPEPATMLLLGTGLAGLAGTRVRRKKKA